MFFFDIPSKIFGHEFGVIVINIEFVKSEYCLNSYNKSVEHKIFKKWERHVKRAIQLQKLTQS